MSSRLFDLSDKTIVVSGGTGFLGTQFCVALAESNACVIAADLFPFKKNDAERVAEQVIKDKIFYEFVDITSKKSIDLLVDTIKKKVESVDVLINCAAIDPKFEADDKDALNAQRFTSFRLDIWKESMNVNITGTFLLTQAMCCLFEKQQRGNIINISSIYGVVGPDQRIYNEGNEMNFVKPVTYSICKAALLGFTRYLASYYRGKNIRANTLTPGGVERDHDPDFIKRYSSKTILGRMAGAKELNGAIVFLSSDASSYMTGANLIVDGGWTAF
ncbi:MAG: SDR family oxidoreductase [Desulfobacterales bacterium]